MDNLAGQRVRALYLEERAGAEHRGVKGRGEGSSMSTLWKRVPALSWKR